MVKALGNLGLGLDLESNPEMIVYIAGGHWLCPGTLAYRLLPCTKREAELRVQFQRRGHGRDILPS